MYRAPLHERVMSNLFQPLAIQQYPSVFGDPGIGGAIGAGTCGPLDGYAGVHPYTSDHTDFVYDPANPYDPPPDHWKPLPHGPTKEQQETALMTFLKGLQELAETPGPPPAPAPVTTKPASKDGLTRVPIEEPPTGRKLILK